MDSTGCSLLRNLSVGWYLSWVDGLAAGGGRNGEDFPGRQEVENPEKAPEGRALCLILAPLRIPRWKPRLSTPGSCQIPGTVNRRGTGQLEIK